MRCFAWTLPVHCKAFIELSQASHLILLWYGKVMNSKAGDPSSLPLFSVFSLITSAQNHPGTEIGCQESRAVCVRDSIIQPFQFSGGR